MDKNTFWTIIKGREGDNKLLSDFKSPIPVARKESLKVEVKIIEFICNARGSENATGNECRI